jgi:hypothetical protein
MRFKLFILTSVFFLSYQLAKAQINANFEASLNLGLASFQTDYGERGDFKSGVSGNVGFAVGGSLYVNFFNTDPSITGDPNWMQRHLKLKLEASYLSAKLEHFGLYKEENSHNGNLLENMKGSTSVINFGTILEYHPFVIPDFVPGISRKLSPYLGLGVMGGYAMPSVETDQSKLIEAYQGGTNRTDATPFLTYSLIPSAGVRFRFDSGQVIMLDMRWQYFNSDFVDGLNPNDDLVPNKHNDWLYYLNIGYVFIFDKDEKSSTW